MTAQTTLASGELGSIRANLLFGCAVALLLVGGVGVWAATTVLSGAVLAAGSVVVESSVKKVQHLSGGIVAEIAARDGHKVRGGDILVRLDDTVLRANLAIVAKGIVDMTARKARLEAQGVAVEPVRVDEYTGRRFTFFSDPDGLPLELYEA